MFPFGFWGWGGNMFPYTNFHDMNLDWIIWQVKHNKDSIEQFRGELEQMGVDIEEFRQYIENIDSEIQQEVQTQVPIAINHEIQTGGFNSLLSQSHKRRIVCIGDSYGDGWTPDGSFPSWIPKLKAKLNIANEDWCGVSVGGTGFGKDASVPNQYLPNIIQTAYENISNPATVTDVIFGLGYNDYLYADNPTRITNGINTAITTCRQKFPTAKVHIYAIGFTTNKTVQNALNTVYNYYARGLYNYQFSNMSDCLSEVALFSSDGIHPVEAGLENIARRMCNVFNNSTDHTTYPNDLSGAENTFEMIVGGQQDVTGWLGYARSENGLYLTNVSAFKNITPVEPFNITGATLTKIAKLKSSPYTGYYYPRPYIATHATLYYIVSGSTDYHEMPVAVTLSQDLRVNDHEVYLWIKTEGMGNTGFKAINNISSFGLTNVCVPLPFIAKF